MDKWDFRISFSIELFITNRTTPTLIWKKIFPSKSIPNLNVVFYDAMMKEKYF